MCFLFDVIVFHDIVDKEEVVGVLELGGLGLHQNSEDFAEDVAESDCVNKQGESDVNCF